MGAAKKSTIYVDPEMHRAARVYAAGEDLSISDVINKALAAYFSDMEEDLEDIKTIKRRKNEPRVSMEKVLKKLKADGVI